MRYQKIAVAAGFSPTLPAVLAEAERWAGALRAPWSVIHAAGEDAAKAEAFAEAFRGLNFPPEGVVWSPGATPLDGILAAIKSADYDLLIAGALEREPEHRAFLGGVARGLLRELCCDKLFLTRPRTESANPLKLIAAMEPRGQERRHLAVVAELCQILPVAEVLILGTDSPLAAAAGLQPRQRVAEAAEELRSKTSVPVDSHCIQSNTGFGICDFVQGVEPDLLVAAATLENGRYILPRHLSWLLQVIPCNTLVVRG